MLISIETLLIQLTLKIMKYILSFFLTLSVLCTSLSAVEYFNISVNEGDFHDEFVILNDGDYLEIIGTNQNSVTFIGIIPLDSSLSINDINSNNYRQKGTIEVYKNVKIAGPAKLTFYGQHSSPAASIPIFSSYKLTRASEVEYKNVNIVALPTATVGAGTHEIVVEASDDLQTWTPVHSSSIGGSKAFFRTRVVEAGE